MSRPTLEVADVIRRHANELLESRGSSITSDHKYVLKSLAACRTAALGGHLERCDHCAHERPAYNSCGNRHCPKCQQQATADWFDARQKEVLPVPYFHLIFTIPHLLNRLTWQNKKVVYNILFAAAAEALQEVAANPKHLGAKIGFVAVLHSWGQNLLEHPHLHCLIPGGGLSPDGSRWVRCREIKKRKKNRSKYFFLPVRVLSHEFRKKFLQRLRRAQQKGELTFHGSVAALRDQQVFDELIQQADSVKWSVFAQPPLTRSDADNPQRIVKYLARYTHRVAISNHRLVALKEGRVTFRWKNYRRGGRQQLMTLKATEFIRRFLLHVLPPGFQRIRHFGLLANCHRATQLKRCRYLLGVDNDSPNDPDNLDQENPPAAELLEPDQACCCPVCGQGKMVIISQRPRPTAGELLYRICPFDTS